MKLFSQMVQLVSMMGRIGKKDDVTTGEGMVERIRRITGLEVYETHWDHGDRQQHQIWKG